MRRPLLLLVAMVAGLFLLGSAAAAVGPVRQRVNDLFWTITLFAFGVAFIVYGALITFLIRYRRSVSPTAAQIEGNRKLEVLWTVFPTIILILITAISIPVLVYTDTPPPHDYTVVAIGQRWSWTFNYYDLGHEANLSNPDLVTNGELWIEANTTVSLKVTSVDVIHSFAVADLGVKIDAFPGQYNDWWLRADAPGDYLTQCAEFCGLGHYGMNATVHVFSKAQRDAEAARLGVPAKPYGPPPVAPQITDVRLFETNATSWGIDPDNLTFNIHQNVTLNVTNEGFTAHDFRIDLPMEGNATGPIAPSESRLLTFTVNESAAPVPYGPTDPVARGRGMVGNLTVRSGTIIVIILGRDAQGNLFIRPDPPQNPLTMTRGETVVFEVKNEDPLAEHSFQMSAPYANVRIPNSEALRPGETRYIGPFTFDENTAGQYWCDIPGHKEAGMIADFAVGSGGGQAAPEVPTFGMMLITFALGIPATLAYVVHHARRQGDE